MRSGASISSCAAAVRRDHGPLGLRQVHAHEPARLPGSRPTAARYWLNGKLVSRTLRARARACPQSPKSVSCSRPSALLPRQSALRECRDAARLRGRARRRAAPARARPLLKVGARRPRAPIAGRALRRAATARCDRPRTRDAAPALLPRRRADRQSRQRDRRRDPHALRRTSPGRQHGSCS